MSGRWDRPPDACRRAKFEDVCVRHNWKWLSCVRLVWLEARDFGKSKPGGEERNRQHQEGAGIGGGVAVVENGFKECGTAGEADDFVEEDIREEVEGDGGPECSGFQKGG